MDIEDYEKYELNVKATIIANIPFAMLFVFLAMYTITLYKIVNGFVAPDMKIIGLMVFAYSVIKGLHMVFGSIQTEYKLKGD